MIAYNILKDIVRFDPLIFKQIKFKKNIIIRNTLQFLTYVRHDMFVFFAGARVCDIGIAPNEEFHNRCEK